MNCIKIGVFENNDGIIPVLIPKNFRVDEILVRFDVIVNDFDNASPEFRDTPPQLRVDLNLKFSNTPFGMTQDTDIHFNQRQTTELIPNAPSSGQFHFAARWKNVGIDVPEGFYAVPSVTLPILETPWYREIHLIGTYY